MMLQGLLAEAGSKQNPKNSLDMVQRESCIIFDVDNTGNY